MCFRFEFEITESLCFTLYAITEVTGQQQVDRAFMEQNCLLRYGYKYIFVSIVQSK